MARAQLQRLGAVCEMLEGRFGLKKQTAQIQLVDCGVKLR